MIKRYYEKPFEYSVYDLQRRPLLLKGKSGVCIGEDEAGNTKHVSSFSTVEETWLLEFLPDGRFTGKLTLIEEPMDASLVEFIYMAERVFYSTAEGGTLVNEEVV